MKKIPLLILSLVLLTAACSPEGAPTQAGGSLTAWIDAPLDGSTIPLAPYQIVAHGSDPEEIQRLEISVEGEILGVVENPAPADLLLTAQVSWVPPAPGVYTITARGQNREGSWSGFAQAQVTVIEDLQAPQSSEPLPTETPVSELVNCLPEITASTNTTCRKGPTTYNEPALYFTAGDTAPILGGNQDLTWWAVLPESLAEACWVSEQTVETNCLPEGPPILDAPPYITRVFPFYEEFYWGDHHLRSVTIQAQSGGEIPVTGIRLIYHLAGRSDWYNTAMVNTEGEIWQADIQAHTFNNYQRVTSSVVEYYLEAVNEAGLMAKSPLYNNLKLKEVP